MSSTRSFARNPWAFGEGHFAPGTQSHDVKPTCLLTAQIPNRVGARSGFVVALLHPLIDAGPHVVSVVKTPLLIVRGVHVAFGVTGRLLEMPPTNWRFVG